MDANLFIPFYIPALINYLKIKFNIDINNIPIHDLKSLVYYKYCKNITDGKLCVRPCKKANEIKEDEEFICSKCCEKNKIKRKKVYRKKKKPKNNEQLDNMNNGNESGYYSETDNNLYLKSNEIYGPINNYSVKLQNLKYEKELSFNNELSEKKENKINFGDLEIELDNKYLINNLRKLKHENNVINHNINNKYITFGSLNINIEADNIINNEKIVKKNKYINNKVLNNNENNKIIKRIFTKIRILIYFKNLYLNNKSKKSNIVVDGVIHGHGIKKDIFISNNNYNFLKLHEININSDLYYIFTYLIYLVFKNSDIEVIKYELYNCLGNIGVQHYISQYISYSNNGFFK